MVNKSIVLEGHNKVPFTLDLYTDSNHNPSCVLYVHGFNGFKDWGNFLLIAKEFVASGVDIASFNFSHNGTSLSFPQDFVELNRYGSNNYTIELYDLGKVIDYIEGLNRYTKIILLGHSRGGGISILKAAEDKRITALITWASVSECKTPWAAWSQEKLDVWQQNGVAYYENKRTNQRMPLYYQLYINYIQNQDRLNVLRAIQNLTIPILIQHGKADEAVSYRSAECLHNANPNSKLILYDTNHTFGRSHPYLSTTLPLICEQAIQDAIRFLNK